MQSSNPGQVDRFTAITSGAAQDAPGVRTRMTTKHEEIRRWAVQHAAEPATGEETSSGPSVRHVNDMGAGIRFNFPGFAPYRTIAWREWFENFEAHCLVFVYEESDHEQVATLARERWHTRGGGDGDDQQDWFEAEHELRLRRAGGAADTRYRFMKRDELVLETRERPDEQG
jgi:hypothetical protein